MPAAWVCANADLADSVHTVLDLAAGRGRHSRWFLEQGCPVTAVDREVADLLALRAEFPAQLEVVAADLEGAPWPLEPGRRFGRVVVVNYLWRPLWSRILGAVAPRGLLLYETFMVGQETVGRPRRPEFLLQAGELRRILPSDWSVLAFHEGLGTGGFRQGVVARAPA